MMRNGAPRAERTIWISVAVLLVLWFAATANAQDTQEPSTFPCYVRTEGCVRKEYDRFQDKTFVTMTPAQLTFPSILGQPSLVSVAIGAEFSSPGDAIKRPETVTLTFITFALSANPFADRKGVYLLIDGKPYPLGDVSLEKESPGDYESRYSLRAPFAAAEKIALAKAVEIRIGSAETTIDEKVQASFRRLVELVPKEEHAISESRKNTSLREPKRPKSKRSLQRGKP